MITRLIPFVLCIYVDSHKNTSLCNITFTFGNLLHTDKHTIAHYTFLRALYFLLISFFHMNCFLLAVITSGRFKEKDTTKISSTTTAMDVTLPELATGVILANRSVRKMRWKVISRQIGRKMWLLLKLMMMTQWKGLYMMYITPMYKIITSYNIPVCAFQIYSFQR